MHLYALTELHDPEAIELFISEADSLPDMQETAASLIAALVLEP